MAEAAAQPAAPPVTAEANGIDALLQGDLSGEGPQPGDDILDAIAGNTPAAEGDEPAEATEPETEAAEPKDPAAKLDDEVIFSEEALKTPEGIQKARARIKDLRRMSHEKYLELKSFERRVVKRHEKLKHQVQRYVTGKRQDEILLGNVRSNLEGLHSGDPDSILAGLGGLTGMDGIKALELLNSRLVNRGKSPLDPQVQALIDSLKSEITELKGGWTQRETQARTRELATAVSQRQQALGQQITSRATELPILNRLYADNPQSVLEYVTDEIVEAHKAGTPLDAATYFGNLEQQLSKHFGAAQAPKGDGGGPAPKQPSQVQRSPGQSVGPRTAAASNPREPSEEESLRALANDPDLMSAFGF